MIVLTFAYLFGGFLRDQSTAKNDAASWKVMGVASLFWPIALPLSYLERKANRSGSPPERYEVMSAHVTLDPAIFRAATPLSTDENPLKKGA